MNINGVGSTSNLKPIQYGYPLNVYITKRVSGYHLNADLDFESWNFPKNITLGDERSNESQPMDMLIGADAFF